MLVQSIPTPRLHLTAAAKRLALEAIKSRRITLAAPHHDGRPLVNRFGRKYLPIDAGIPLPESVASGSARPFGLMQVGESFWEAAAHCSVATLLKRIKWDAKAYVPAKFGYENICQNGVDGIRVWRLQ